MILNTLLNRILTRDYFEDLLQELHARMEDSEGLEAEILEKRIAIREIDRNIQNLLDLAESFGAGAALDRLKQREVERVGLVSELDRLEAKKEISKVEISPEALSLAIDFYLPIVSKSLLIVLGTLSMPAKNDGEKCRQAVFVGLSALLTVLVLQCLLARNLARCYPL